jgi:hypothetical protein
MTLQYTAAWKILAHHVQQYWIGNRENALRNIRVSVSNALAVPEDQLVMYDEREMIVSYLRKQSNALRSHFATGPKDTTSVIVSEVVDAVEAIAKRIQDGEHVESMLGDFALSPNDIKRLKRARNGHAADEPEIVSV